MRGLLVSVLLFVGIPAYAQEVGGELGSPSPQPEEPEPDESEPDVAPETQTEWQTELQTQTGEGHDPTHPTQGAQRPAQAQVQGTQTEPIPPPPDGQYVVPEGYSQNPAPPRSTVAPTHFQVRPAAPRRVRVRVREGTEVPADARLYERRSKFLLIPGVIAFAVSYSVALSGAIVGDEGLLYAPFVGPLLWQLDEGNSDTAGLMVLLTLAQTAGVFLFAFGMRKKTYAEWYTGGDRRIALAAVPTRRGAALTLRVW